MTDAPEILKDEKLRDSYPKLNAAIRNANEALSTANTAKTAADGAVNTANAANEKSDFTQTQLDTVTGSGTIDPAVEQMKVDLEGVVHPSPDARFRSEFEKRDELLADIGTQKADTSYVDNKVVGAVSGAPIPVSLVANMIDQTRNYVYTGTESGYTAGNWYYWNGTAWTSGGVYQSTGISPNSISFVELKDKTVTADNTDFFNLSSNLYNKSTDVLKFSIAANGSLSSNQYVNSTDFMKVVPNNSYTTLGFSRYALYDKNKTFISYSNIANASSAFTLTTPSNASYVRFHYDNTQNVNRQVNKGTALLAYEEYYIKAKDEVTVNYKTLYNAPSITKVKNDIVKNSFVYGDSAGDYIGSLATHSVVNDFEGFRSPSGYLLKVTYPVGNASIAYSLKKFSSTIERSGKYGNLVFMTNVYTNSLQAGETAEIKMMTQAGTSTSYLGYDSFSKSQVITLENGKPKTTFLELKGGELKPFINGVFGISVKNAVNPIDIYISLSYAGADLEVSQAVTTSISYGDYGRLSETGAIARTPKDSIAPSKVYVTANDIPGAFGTARQYSSALYIDHMLSDNDDNDMTFAEFNQGEGDKYYFYNPSYYNGNTLVVNNGNNIDTTTKTVQVSSAKYDVSQKTINQISTKQSLSKSQHPKVLFIGDSITYGVGARAESGQYGNGDFPYWAYVKELFEMDKIDGGDLATDYNFTSLGIKKSYSVPIDYKGVSRNVKVSADGLSGWSLFNFLHHSTVLTPSQSTWDTLGLGNGSGTDYTGSTAQKDLIASTNENNAIAEPNNPYFDNSLTGQHKFSIRKWLERYRTRDDNGAKLSLGDPALGTMITTQQQIDDYNVCTPTHIVLSHGRNDLGYASVSKFIENEELFISAVKAELPNVVIGICTVPDNPGTFFANRYDKIVGNINMQSNHAITYEGVKQQLATFDNREAENIYLLPNYFTQPTAWGFMLQDVSMPPSFLNIKGWQQEEFRRYRPLGDGVNNHLGSQAHTAWGYQVYSWLKYVLSK